MCSGKSHRRSRSGSGPAQRWGAAAVIIVLRLVGPVAVVVVRVTSVLLLLLAVFAVMLGWTGRNDSDGQQRANSRSLA